MLLSPQKQIDGDFCGKEFLQFPLLKPDVIVAKLSRNSPVVTTSRKCCRVFIYTEMNKFTRNDTLVLYG